MPESTQHKLDRIRPPRVQITYDLEVGDALVMKELPMVVGIMSDLSGKRKEPLPQLKNRNFVEIDRDNFNDVMASIGPSLEFTVENKLTKEGGNFKVALDLEEIDDFHPSSIIQQVEPLRKLFEARQRLLDLFVKLDGNDDLENLLQEVMRNTTELQEVQGLQADSSADETEAKSADSVEDGAGSDDSAADGDESTDSAEKE